jgi:hypothetical protein
LFDRKPIFSYYTRVFLHFNIFFMNTFVKGLAVLMLLSFTSTSSYAAYTEVTCTSNPDFTANSCNQCFEGGPVAQGDNKGLLTDLWENTGTVAQVLFKEEQDMPEMIPLGWASWTQVKASEDVTFWQYTPALQEIYSEEDLGYVLPAGDSVIWLESTLGSAYQLTANPVENGKNVGILAYDLVVHDVESDGTPALESKSHRECVLFTSSATPTTPVAPEPPKELPQTGPEHIFLGFVALLLAFGFMKFRKKA